MGKLERGTVVEKHSARDLENERTVYFLMLECHGDTACQECIVVSKEMFDASVIRGFGHDTVVEYGCVLRIVGDEAVPPSTGEKE